MSKEELTTKMHSEFNIASEANVKLTVFMAIEDMNDLGYSLSDVTSLYNITEEQIKKYTPDYTA